MVNKQVVTGSQSGSKECVITSFSDMVSRMEEYRFLDAEIFILTSFLEKFADCALVNVSSFALMLEHYVQLCKKEILGSQASYQKVLSCIFASEEGKDLFIAYLGG